MITNISNTITGTATLSGTSTSGTLKYSVCDSPMDVTTTGSTRLTAVRLPQFLGSFIAAESDINKYAKVSSILCNAVAGDTVIYNNECYKYSSKATNTNTLTYTTSGTWGWDLPNYTYKWIKIEYAEIGEILSPDGKLYIDNKQIFPYKKQRSIKDVIDFKFKDGKTIVRFNDNGKEVVTYAMVRDNDEFNESTGISICLLKYLAGDSVYSQIDNMLVKRDKAIKKEKAKKAAELELKKKAEVKKEKIRQKRLEAKAKKQAEFDFLVKQKTKELENANKNK